MIYHCLIIDDEPTAREIIASHIAKVESLKLVGSCKNAVEAFDILSKEKVDLIFLDINMPELSGLSFARSIRKDIKIIFTTAYREYALDGFDLQAVDYLLKPISLERFMQATHKFLGEKNPVVDLPQQKIESYNADFIFVRSERKMIKLDFSDIDYVESLSDYIKIYTTTKTIISRETISNIEAKLPQHKFIRVHRSFLLAVSKINSFTHEYIALGNKSIPISRSYKNVVLNYLEQLS